MPVALDTYRTVTPYLVVPDADVEIKFLETAFDAVTGVCERGPTGAVRHAEVRIGDTLIMIGQASDEWKALPCALYLWVPNVDAIYEKAQKCGATSVMAPADMPYGHRNGGVLDGAGITWWIGSPVAGA